MPTIAPRSFPAGLLYSPSLPSLYWCMGLFHPGAELCTLLRWTSGFCLGCYLSVYQSLRDLASSANLMFQPVTAILDHVGVGREVSAPIDISWILCLGQLCFALKTILVQRSRKRWAFCSGIVFCPSCGEGLQRSLISVPKNKLGFHVWLTGFYIRTKRLQSCLGLGCHFSASPSYCGCVGIGDLLNTSLLINIYNWGKK